MSQLIRIILPIAVLAVGYFSFHQLSDEKEMPPPRIGERRLIEAQANPLQREDYQVVLQSQGLVQPHNRTSLTPRVGGRVREISPNFESGSFFKKGETLLVLDPTDFQTAKTAALARLARAEASLAQEDARAKQALLDWNDLGYTEPPTDLVLRKPQLKEAKANVKAAQADLDDAIRDLERTEVIAPYAGRVRQRLVGLGQSVSSGTVLGEIFSTDFAEVRLSLSAKELIHVKLPDNPEDPPVDVTLVDALTEGSEKTWEGEIVRTEGILDAKSRKLFVIARVNDPFGLEGSENKSNNEPLRIGQPVRAILEGATIPDVFVIPRKTLYRPNEILTIHPTEFTLKRQKITPIWTDPENLVVSKNLIEGWYLVTNRLTAAPEGAKVEIVEPEEVPKAALKKEDPKPAA
ncbi:MAG: efflux RND transporter periplasmic adaptor subunit [Akkermansiaceae bacterium]|nr:efflux RND transporter periplasmic adaptor subunit [Akkermansiaceae bacterium]